MCHRPNPLVEAFRLGLPERQRKHDEAVKELGRDPSKRRDRTDPEGGIPGRYGPGDVAGSMSRTQRHDVRAALAGLYSGPLRLPMPHYGEARLYCDMDGVAADFDRRYHDLFGKMRERHTDWSDVRSVPDFFLKIPVMKDWPLLWDFIKPYSPIFLTGCPLSVNPAANDKVQWVRNHVGDEVPVICCKAKHKRLYCRPGDVLIDDSEEYRGLWEAAGGIWITHKSAADTIEMLKSKGFC
jgi:hypothetical protein